MFGFSAATSAFELSAICALASHHPPPPPFSSNRGKLCLLTTLSGWERNVMYAETAQNFLSDTHSKPRPWDAFQRLQPNSPGEEMVHSFKGQPLEGTPPPPFKKGV